MYWFLLLSKRSIRYQKTERTNLGAEDVATARRDRGRRRGVTLGDGATKFPSETVPRPPSTPLLLLSGGNLDGQFRLARWQPPALCKYGYSIYSRYGKNYVQCHGR